MTTDTTNDGTALAAQRAAGTLGAARVGLWLLPVYAALLALSTLTHQPDARSDFPAYARYVTTDLFLASHLVGSIVGGALGLLGVVAALAFLVRGLAARLAVWGAALTVVGNVIVTAVFGAAAFAQPGIGRAYLDGLPQVEAVDEDVYGAPLFATAGVPPPPGRRRGDVRSCDPTHPPSAAMGGPRLRRLPRGVRRGGVPA